MWKLTQFHTVMGCADKLYFLKEKYDCWKLHLVKLSILCGRLGFMLESPAMFAPM